MAILKLLVNLKKILKYYFLSRFFYDINKFIINSFIIK
jgi:hypothetical protein